MKKLLTSVIILSSIIVAFSSCGKRDYTCTCTWYDINGKKQEDATTMSGTLKKAQNGCNAHGSDLQLYVSRPVSCSLQ